MGDTSSLSSSSSVSISDKQIAIITGNKNKLPTMYELLC